MIHLIRLFIIVIYVLLSIYSFFLYVTFPSNNDSKTVMAINLTRPIIFSNYTYNAYSYSIYIAHLIYYTIQLQVFIRLGTVKFAL